MEINGLKVKGVTLTDKEEEIQVKTTFEKGDDKLVLTQLLNKEFQKIDFYFGDVIDLNIKVVKRETGKQMKLGED